MNKVITITQDEFDKKIVSSLDECLGLFAKGCTPVKIAYLLSSIREEIFKDADEVDEDNTELNDKDNDSEMHSVFSMNAKNAKIEIIAPEGINWEDISVSDKKKIQDLALKIAAKSDDEEEDNNDIKRS
jgi:hypothetical protein